jgi:hypothetical protein
MASLPDLKWAGSDEVLAIALSGVLIHTSTSRSMRACFYAGMDGN